MRIIFICRALTIGGAERQLVLLARGLVERGHQVTIICFYGDGALAADAADCGIEMLGLLKRSRYQLIRPLLQVRREVSHRLPDIVHGYLPVANLLTLVAWTLRRRPKIIWGLRNSDMRPGAYDRLSRIAYWLERRLSSFADLVIANSLSGARFAQARGFRAKQLRVIPNGVELNRFHPDQNLRAELRQSLGIPADAPLIGHFARLDPMKDHETFLQAVRRVASRRAVFALCVAGGPEDKVAALDSRISELGLSAIVKRLPATSRSERLFPACDLYFLSSRYGEGCPNVVLEAMAGGVPCVVTDVGDAAVLVDGLGGVAPAGDPDSLAVELENMICRIADGTAPQVSLLRQRAAEFTPERLAKATEQAFADLL